MEIRENAKTESSVQNILNNQRNTGFNSNNQHNLAGSLTPAFTVIQDSKNSDNICPTCGERLRRDAVVCGIKYSFHVTCKCERKQQEAEQKKQENLDKMRKIENLKRLSLLGERYKNVTFDNSKTGANSTFDTAFNRCKKYCEIYDQVIKTWLWNLSFW